MAPLNWIVKKPLRWRLFECLEQWKIEKFEFLATMNMWEESPNDRLGTWEEWNWQLFIHSPPIPENKIAICNTCHSLDYWKPFQYRNHQNQFDSQINSSEWQFANFGHLRNGKHTLIVSVIVICIWEKNISKYFIANLWSKEKIVTKRKKWNVMFT